jgi:2-polyprenyl-6-methoxyphenol hydroxylase-like FAD-dependent oxidoreductase
VAGLVAAAECHAKGMKVQIFEQASQYAPYGGPIQIQSNALRALQRINPIMFDETVTVDRVSGCQLRRTWRRQGNQGTYSIIQCETAALQNKGALVYFIYLSRANKMAEMRDRLTAALVMHQKRQCQCTEFRVLCFLVHVVVCDAHAYAPILCIVFQRSALLYDQVISWLCLGGYGEALQCRLHRLVIH